jgi:Protein of unknown function (DUF3122)
MTAIPHSWAVTLGIPTCLKKDILLRFLRRFYQQSIEINLIPFSLGHMLLVKFLLRVCLIALFCIGFAASPAAAEIRQFHETPGTLLYKSQWTLRDQHDRAWQAIAFQVRQPEQPFAVQLRLVGFPGSVQVKADQPLLLDNRQQFLSAPLIDFATPPEVGQFDLQPVLAKLNARSPLYLTMATLDGTIELKVPPFLVEEWQSLPDRGMEN